MEVNDENRWRSLWNASREVGPPLIFLTSNYYLSFLPVFTLEAQEGRCLHPWPFTKTYAMAMAAGIIHYLGAGINGVFIRGHITPEHKNPVNRILVASYKPFIRFYLHSPWKVIVLH